MNEHNARNTLIEFLDRMVFDPILRTRGDEASSEAEKRLLADVRQSTKSEKKRFHHDCRTAEAVRDNYLFDLSSHGGQRTTRELRELRLPNLPAVKDEFLRLCNVLGISADH